MDPSGRLREELQFLEEGYRDQPPAIRTEDLAEINRLRAQLGMRPVDHRLVEIGGVEEAEDVQSAEHDPEAVDDADPDPHLEARDLYQRYLQKLEQLKRYRQYADRVANATDGRGTTPVRPLATMGTDGGPLLCDYCKKPIVLEGGSFHGKAADLAWQEHPAPPDDWASWILGGLVVEIETNKTLRIYHGYPRQRNACCGKARAIDDVAREQFDSSEWFEKELIVTSFVRDELLPGADAREQRALATEILDTLFGYDPGVGINGPGTDQGPPRPMTRVRKK